MDKNFSALVGMFLTEAISEECPTEVQNTIWKRVCEHAMTFVEKLNAVDFWENIRRKLEVIDSDLKETIENVEESCIGLNEDSREEFLDQANTSYANFQDLLQSAELNSDFSVDSEVNGANNLIEAKLTFAIDALFAKDSTRAIIKKFIDYFV